MQIDLPSISLRRVFKALPTILTILPTCINRVCVFFGENVFCPFQSQNDRPNRLRRVLFRGRIIRFTRLFVRPSVNHYLAV